MAYTLTGQYVYGNGAPRRGRIKFAPSVAIAGDDTVILPSPLTVDLDSGGSFSVPLVGTDDVAYSPSGWVWSCVEVLDGGRTFSFELTADSDIHALTPVAVPDEYSVYVEVGAELAASLTSGDATLLQVPLADGSGGISWGDQSGGSGGGASLSDTTPLDLGTAAAGTGVAASREDHVHGMPTAADVGASAVGHGHTLEDVSDAGGAAALDVGTTAGTVAAGDDSRFTDARTPTAHATSHGAGQADAITVAQSQVSGLDTALAALVANSTYDAHTILAATADDTPAALTVAEQRVVGRITGGNIAALTAAQLLTMQSGQSAVNTVGASGATVTLPATYEFHDVTMDQDCTLSFASPTGSGHVFVLVLRGAFTPTLAASVDWAGGTPPGYSSVSMYTFATVDGGTTWLGTLVGSAYA